MENASYVNLSKDSNDISTVMGDMIFGLVGMIIIDVLAFWGNLMNIIVILSKPQLRHNLSNLLVLNLCFIEISASILLLPTAIVSYCSGTWIFGNFFCSLIGFLGSLFSFGSITNLCVISVERFYSIRFPMHHAGHMSLTKILLMIMFIWAESLVLSMPPLIGINSYSYRPHKKQCSFSWELETWNKVYVLIIGVLCFIVPAIILFIMYWGIFRVAHRALTQVNPRVYPRNVPDRPTDSTSSPTTSESGLNKRLNTNTTTISIPHGHPIPGKKHHLKAIKTLSITLTTFVIFWGPYYLYHGYGAMRDNVEYRAVVEVLVLWLGYCAFAMNPFLYSFLNRAIRNEIIELYKKIFCCRLWFRSDEDDDEDDNLEDQNFIQFLERSASTRGKGHSSRRGTDSTARSKTDGELASGKF